MSEGGRGREGVREEGGRERNETSNTFCGMTKDLCIEHL